MLTRWTSHLRTDEEKEIFRRDILSARSVLERLSQMVEEDERALTKSEISPTSYSTPNWDYHQAHKNGVRQYINQIKTLVDLDHRKELN